MEEYMRFYESDEKRPIFAGTENIFEIGDNVECNGKLYQVEAFFRSFHAEPDVIDWLRLRRGGLGIVWADVAPSEVKLLSRNVSSA